MVLPRLVALATTFLGALAFAGPLAETSQDCTPAESAACAGVAYRDELQRLKGVLQSKLEKLVQSLPEQPFDRINLPSKASMQALNRSWLGYVESYCDVYWYAWPGASTWKSAEAIECQVEAHRRYEVFIDRVQVCTASDGACELLTCTPFDCKPKKH